MAMRARVHRGRIRVRWDEPDPDIWLPQRDQILTLIGSGSVPHEDQPEVSCALSVTNFRKLKSLGCKLQVDDERTMEIVRDLRQQQLLYDEESRSGDAAKAGKPAFEGYEFKVPPLAHQPRGFHFLHSMKTPALFGDCATGKTFIVLTFADSLVKAGVEMVFLVVCPVNLIRWVWMEDAKKFTDLTTVGLREPTVVRVLAEDFDDPKDPELSFKERAALRKQRRTAKEWKAKARRRAQARRRKLLDARFAQDVDMYIINPENLRTDSKERRVRDLCKRKLKEGKQICLVIDESSKIKSKTSRTYKALKRIRKDCERCIIMTGTPSPNGILDLWAQFSVLDGGMTLQPSYTDYRHEFAREIVLKGVTWEGKDGKTHNATKWAPRPGAARKVYRTLQPRMIRFKLEDCIDLPPIRTLIREVSMTAEQAEVYEDIENMLFTELEGQPVTATVAATKRLKLRQITGGFLITDEGDATPIGKTNPKMVELDDLLQQSVGDKLGDDGPPLKALIWAQYRWECKTLVRRYSRRFGARAVYGGISSGAKDDAIRRFKEDPLCRILVAHPGSIGHGMNLTEASYAFYYSLSDNYDELYQSYRRITRPGQTRSMTFYFLACPDTVDDELLEAARQKKNLSDLITDGKYDRNSFLEIRKKVRKDQLQLSWEVPDADASTTEGR